MKTKLFTLLILINLGLMTNCSKTDNVSNQIEFKSIGQGNLYGNGQENIIKENLVISDSNSWNELIDKMNSVNNESDGFTETNIDFSNFIVIAVFDKIYGNGGHSIDITNITENENNVIIKVENILKGDLTSVITQPYDIVKIPKNDKLTIFE